MRSLADSLSVQIASHIHSEGLAAGMGLTDRKVAQQFFDARLYGLKSDMHESIIECSQNLFFMAALKRVDRLRRVIDCRQMRDRDIARERCVEHVELLTLILAGRNKGASDVMRKHLGALGPLKGRAERGFRSGLK